MLSLHCNNAFIRWLVNVIKPIKNPMNATVLVVEDEPAIQELISYNLKQAGHQPMRADNANRPAPSTGRAPDLVLLDWMLPGLSGIDCAAAAGDKRTKTIPISC
jgi:two-component system phosphate regulon response regulator PhoB